MPTSDGHDPSNLGLPSRPALQHVSSSAAQGQSPRSKTRVTIEDPELVSPLMLAKTKAVADDFRLDGGSTRQHTAGLNKRLSGRLPSFNNDSTSQSSPRLNPADDGASRASEADSNHEHLREFLNQVTGWISAERSKRQRRKMRAAKISTSDAAVPSTNRRLSDSSSDSDSLSKLESMVSKGMSLFKSAQVLHRKSSSLGRRASIRKLRRASSFVVSSDTEYEDSSIQVPSCDAVLDNSKTLSYSDPKTSSQSNLLDTAKSFPRKDKEAWSTFKYEIVRLAHTLRLEGWRQVPMEKADDITVERLSGALTNAVYVVIPPENLPERPKSSANTQQAAQPQGTTSSATGSSEQPTTVRKRKPPKLLLRIYGPQVEHLIDRESELMILRRLARKRIGPRLLGTFNNGRFEEFLHARTLRPEDFRQPETSNQIAKRMRELHDGIELLVSERSAGPFVWQNWDKWVKQSGKIAKMVDGQRMIPPSKANGNEGSEKRFLCGTDWETFRRAVEGYRAWLEEQYGGMERLKEQLVFAHNDTQYGNILRLEPPGESPLLHPSNEHKQLVVIDFEYANANLPALEFANHFTEWCYDYHHETTAFVCNASRYPTLEEQNRFIRAYLTHRPQFPGTFTTPRLGPVKMPFDVTSGKPTDTSEAQPFDLDNVTSGAKLREQEERAEASLNTETRRLMYEARLWRVALSAQWTLWGIIQSQASAEPTDATNDSTVTASPAPMSDPLDAEGKLLQEDAHDKRRDEAEESEHEEFDCLNYARERAMFFWGDMLTLGLVKEEDVTEEVRREAKRITR